jgi:hypothetical protein
MPTSSERYHAERALHLRSNETINASAAPCIMDAASENCVSCQSLELFRSGNGPGFHHLVQQLELVFPSPVVVWCEATSVQAEYRG